MKEVWLSPIFHTIPCWEPERVSDFGAMGWDYPFPKLRKGQVEKGKREKDSHVSYYHSSFLRQVDFRKEYIYIYIYIYTHTHTHTHIRKADQ